MKNDALSAVTVLTFPPLFLRWRTCVRACISKSALHWPDPGCCTEIPVSPAQQRKVMDARAGRMRVPHGRTLCNAQDLQSRARCSTACIPWAPPTCAELKSLCCDVGHSNLETSIWKVVGWGESASGAIQIEGEGSCRQPGAIFLQ